MPPNYPFVGALPNQEGPQHIENENNEMRNEPVPQRPIRYSLLPNENAHVSLSRIMYCVLLPQLPYIILQLLLGSTMYLFGNGFEAPHVVFNKCDSPSIFWSIITLLMGDTSQVLEDVLASVYAFLDGLLVASSDSWWLCKNNVFLVEVFTLSFPILVSKDEDLCHFLSACSMCYRHKQDFFPLFWLHSMALKVFAMLHFSSSWKSHHFSMSWKLVPLVVSSSPSSFY